MIYVGKFLGVVLFVLWMFVMISLVLVVCYLMGGFLLWSDVVLFYMMLLVMII